MKKRFEITYKFLLLYANKRDKIIDLGIDNNLSIFLKNKGFNIENTKGENLDNEYLLNYNYDIITAFEIFEHMLSPYNLLQANNGKLIVSVPLKLWFSKIYWNNKDNWDCHYHEFEKKQFDLLLERTGWRIIDSKLIKITSFSFGIRPILRFFYPKYYFVYAEKN